jgi:hypothetical protein
MRLNEALRRVKEDAVDLGQQDYLVTYQVMAYQKWSEGTLKNRTKYAGFPKRKDGHSNKFSRPEIDAWNKQNFLRSDDLYTKA